MSEFEDIQPRNRGEMPKGEELRKMLETHAFQAGKIFAQKGAYLGEFKDKMINYGAVGNVQLRVTFADVERLQGHERLDSQRLIVDTRQSPVNTAADEGWPALFGQDGFGQGGIEEFDQFVLYDHSRPGAMFGDGKEKGLAMAYRFDAERDFEFGRDEEPIDPEELAYLDSLLTQLASQ